MFFGLHVLDQQGNQPRARLPVGCVPWTVNRCRVHCGVAVVQVPASTAVTPRTATRYTACLGVPPPKNRIDRQRDKLLLPQQRRRQGPQRRPGAGRDRTSGVQGKSVSTRVETGG